MIALISDLLPAFRYFSVNAKLRTWEWPAPLAMGNGIGIERASSAVLTLGNPLTALMGTLRIV
jgi:hypothetical protein